MKHTKFKRVTFDNKKRLFHLEFTSGLRLDCPYSSLGIREKVLSAEPDPESGFHSFSFVLEMGEKNYVPYDQPLHISQHPEYVKRLTLYEITKTLNQFLKREKVSKREIARRLGTSLSQVSRLLDETNYTKELSRLIEIGAMLNYEFKWKFQKAS